MKNEHIAEEPPTETPPTEQPKKSRKKGAKATKARETATTKAVTYPIEAELNAYGFIHLSNTVIEDLGLPASSKSERFKLPIIVTRDGDGLRIEFVNKKVKG